MQLIKIHPSDPTRQPEWTELGAVMVIHFPCCLAAMADERSQTRGFMEPNKQAAVYHIRAVIGGSARVYVCGTRTSSPDLGGVFPPSVIKPTGPPSRHSIPTCTQLTVCLMHVVYHEQPPHIIAHTCTSIIRTVNIPHPHTLIGLDCPVSHPFPLMRDFKKPRINISRPSAACVWIFPFDLVSWHVLFSPIRGESVRYGLNLHTDFLSERRSVGHILGITAGFPSRFCISSGGQPPQTSY